MSRLWKPSANDFGSTPEVERMLRAVTRDDPEGVVSAIEEGADPNAVGKKALTPLLFSLAYKDHLRAIRALVASGADPNYSPPGLPHPMALAAKDDGGELLRLFLELGADPDPGTQSTEPYTATAVYARRFENFRTLVEAGADLNASVGPESPLTGLLIEMEHWDLAAELLRLGADPRPVLASRVTRSAIEHDAPAVGSPDRRAYEEVISLLDLA